MFHPRSHDDIGEYRQHLVCVQHPLLLFQTVSVIKCLNLTSDSLWACRNRFHFVNRWAWFDQFVQVLLTSLERVVYFWTLIDDIYIFYKIFTAFHTHLVDICSKRAMVKAKLIFNCETLGAATTEDVKNLAEFLLLWAKVCWYCVEEEVVELMILKENTSASADDVFLIGNQQIDWVLTKGC